MNFKKDWKKITGIIITIQSYIIFKYDVFMIYLGLLKFSEQNFVDCDAAFTSFSKLISK